MTPTDVVIALKARGIELWQEGDVLRYRAPAGALTDREKAALKAHKASILKALSQPTTTAGGTPVAPALAVTAPFPTPTDPPEPAPKERLCYQCQHFQRSPYGFPLGLCRQHGLPGGLFSDARGNRIQHAASRPAQFGCVDFSLRAPDTNLCTACRSYNPVSTMCRVVNTGCPLPAIPPCTGAHFEPVEGRA